ncbi:hypothetical protein [Paludibaculum fermentans]|nr:hypothetical protein [Paludibaculum fermentans]
MTASLWTWDTFHVGGLVIGVLWTAAEMYITYRQGRDKRSWGKRE